MSQLFTQNIESFVKEAGADFVGFANIENHNHVPGNLTTAVSIGIAYEKSMLLQLPSKELREYIAGTKEKIASVLVATERFLQGYGYKTWVPEISEDIGNLSSVFSHKMAATMSGLGFVGKNDIFISSQFGCGSRLATIFTDAPVEYGRPVTKSQCGSCNKCVEICPCKALKGADWYAGISRDELIDPWLCKKYRDSFKNKLGYIHPCCLCIKVCPW